METRDDDLTAFEAHGAAALPVAQDQGLVEHDGARIWYAAYGSGPPVILLHGGLGSSENWGHQVAPLVDGGYRAVLIDSRGHGRSTRDARPLTYERMASDVLAVMDALRLERARVVGWSDGATTALILARQHPERVARVFFFAGNMDPSGVREISEPGPVLRRMFRRHARDYERLSATPGEFTAFAGAVDLMMRTQPNYTARDLAEVRVPVTIVQSAHDEFILPVHSADLSRNIPGATLVVLPDVSHFAPLQRPQQFNRALLAFLAEGG